METVIGFLAGMVGGLLVIALSYWRRSRPKQVETYTISMNDDSGFQRIELKMKDERGSTDIFLFDPPYSHVLADELCVASARAMRRVPHAAAG